MLVRQRYEHLFHEYIVGRKLGRGKTVKEVEDAGEAVEEEVEGKAGEVVEDG